MEAKELAKLNPEKAFAICKNLEIPSSADGCITNVAKISNQTVYCSELGYDKKIDACYMYFVTNFNDYTLCSKMVNSLYKDSCENLNKLAGLQSTYLSNQESATSGGPLPQTTTTPSVTPKQLNQNTSTSNANVNNSLGTANNFGISTSASNSNVQSQQGYTGVGESG